MTCVAFRKRRSWYISSRSYRNRTPASPREKKKKKAYIIVNSIAHKNIYPAMSDKGNGEPGSCHPCSPILGACSLISHGSSEPASAATNPCAIEFSMSHIQSKQSTSGILVAGANSVQSIWVASCVFRCWEGPCHLGTGPRDFGRGCVADSSRICEVLDQVWSRQ